jgi:putative hydrolase of the HAD superfamily
MKDLFFDLDHTLWDFEKNSREALAEGYDQINLNSRGVCSLEDYISEYEIANAWCWAEYRDGRMDKSELRGRRFTLALKKWGLDNDVTLGEILGSHYVETSPYKTHLVKDALEVVKEFFERGHKLVMLTNGFEEVQHIKVERCGLAPFFNSVLTSDALGVKKPNAGIFKLALELSHSSSENAVMLGDSLESDIIGAREAGWGQVYYNPLKIEHNEEVLYEVSDLISILELPLSK